MLYALTQEQLARVRFPLGGLSKPEVRAIAEENGFVNAAKPDSQDICFVPDGDYARVIEASPGRPSARGISWIRRETCSATHQGVDCYTVGQRRGLGLAVPRADVRLRHPIPEATP